MASSFNRIIIAFGTESGNAERLSRKLSKCPCFRYEKLEIIDLNQLNLPSMTSSDLFLVVTSTFGDGEAPSNAVDFSIQLAEAETIPPFHYAIFAIGDVTYPNFCKFGQDIDFQLSKKGAIRIINRVDADTDHDAFFQQWRKTVCAVVAGDNQMGHQLQLKVTSYNESSPHQAKLINISPLNTSPSLIYQLELDIRDSGMNYRAGDLLYVIPENKSQLLLDLAIWFGYEEVINILKGKELRLLGKSLLRMLAHKSDNEVLKNNLKIRNKRALADYLYSRDLLDVLQECGEPGFISLTELTAALPDQQPRAYSIASCGKYYSDEHSPTQVNLCIREVAYEYNLRPHFGAASHGIRHNRPGGTINVFMRSNPSFHLEYDSDTPIIMIGAGTGIAPYIGFLQQIEQQKIQPETLLIFGERYEKHDFLYQSQLEEWLNQGVLNQLITAFSRDQKQKYYVQDAIVKQGEKIWSLLNNNAILYVCGSKTNLEKPVNQALLLIVKQYGKLSVKEAHDYMTQLLDKNRYRCDLY
ncbi:MAG: sulfite reductase flavoprotein subunit alpha [Methylococcales bacterium]|nr:sulfite reductase flavoprotein subunit alpha [Methylococcales bacterium]